MTRRNPNESVLGYYERLKKNIADGVLDLERSEVYQLLFGEPCSADHARKVLKGLDLCIEADQHVVETDDDGSIQIPNRTVLEIHKDGSQSKSKIIEMSEEESMDGEFLLKAHGFNPSLFELTGAKNSIYQVNAKGGVTKTLYSSKITAKPIRGGLDIEDIAKHFSNFKSTHTATTSQQYRHGAELLVVNLADVHFGKLAEFDETNNTYNLDIARERILGSVESYVSRLHGRQFEKIYFIVGNDYFNCEYHSATIANTPQNNASRYSTMFKRGVETLIDTINILSNVAPVEAIFIPGNHAGWTEYAASIALEAFYRSDDAISVDSAPTPRKYRKFGKNLLCFAHGDSEKDRIFSLPSIEAAEHWSDCNTVEIHLGHYHKEGVVEKNGVTVRRIPSLSGNDYWTYKSGYSSKVRSMAFIYDKDGGLTETHYVNM